VRICDGSRSQHDRDPTLTIVTLLTTTETPISKCVLGHAPSEIDRQGVNKEMGAPPSLWDRCFGGGGLVALAGVVVAAVPALAVLHVGPFSEEPSSPHPPTSTSAPSADPAPTTTSVPSTDPAPTTTSVPNPFQPALRYFRATVVVPPGIVGYLRWAPYSQALILEYLSNGTTVEIECTTQGDPNRSPNNSTFSSLWDRVTVSGYRGYVTDVILNTGSEHAVMPPC
jgi:hypothetical protein